MRPTELGAAAVRFRDRCEVGKSGHQDDDGQVVQSPCGDSPNIDGVLELVRLTRLGQGSGATRGEWSSPRISSPLTPFTHLA